MPPKRPRRHHHLNPRSIAETALDVVDREGVDALSMRRLAHELGVGPTNLYTYYCDRASIVRGVVAILFEEVEPVGSHGLSWEECVREILDSLRAMALKHPRAFPLVAAAAYDEWPLAEYGLRWTRLVMDRGAPPDLYPRLARILDAFLAGFLLLETQDLVRPPKNPIDTFPPAAPFLQPEFTLPTSDEAYDEGVRAIIAGFKRIHERG